MANFVLVPGGCRGGWVWERCASLLRADGHRVYAPTLTGLGDRSHLISSSINLSTHIQDVLNLITSISMPSCQVMATASQALAGLAVSPISLELLKLNHSDRAMVSRLATPHPLATFFEPVALSGKYQSVARKHYILATGRSRILSKRL